MKPTLKVTSDFSKEINDIISRFKNDAVLIGIPEEESNRSATPGKDGKEEPAGNFGNAAILAYNHFGDEERKVPPRRVLSIGMAAAQDQLAEEMKKAAKAALTQGFGAVDQYYNRAGLIASNACKKVINSQTELKAPAPSTLRARKKAGFKGNKTLIVTGQLRNAITYVIRGKT